MHGGIYDADGNWRTKCDHIAAVFEAYFSNLFKKTRGNGVQTTLNNMQSRVTDAMNTHLTGPFSRTEVEQALKQMPATKAPGLDGMPAVFFQKYWHVVGDDVLTSCLEILNGGQSVRSLNHTLIALIPKADKSKLVTQFRPIAQLIAKTIAN